MEEGKRGPCIRRTEGECGADKASRSVFLPADLELCDSEEPGLKCGGSCSFVRNRKQNYGHLPPNETTGKK